MRKWPEGNKTADFSDIAGPLVAALKFCYTLHRRNRNKNVPYKGFNIGDRQRACCLDADEALTAKNLRYNDEDQGRDAVTTIISLAIQLGIEQGRRITMNDYEVTGLRMQRDMAVAMLDDENLARWKRVYGNEKD
jgi:hypothetical protein